MKNLLGQMRGRASDAARLRSSSTGLVILGLLRPVDDLRAREADQRKIDLPHVQEACVAGRIPTVDWPHKNDAQPGRHKLLKRQLRVAGYGDDVLVRLAARIEHRPAWRWVRDR
jgi:hypothetical protein